MGKAVSIELRVQVSCPKCSCPLEELLGFLSERGVPGQLPKAEIDGSSKCLDILGEYGIVDINLSDLSFATYEYSVGKPKTELITIRNNN